MAAALGNDARLFIQSAVAGTFNQIAGQRDLDLPRKAGSIDIGDKNSAPYGKTAPGNFDVTITLEGVPDLPDANGLARADAQFKARDTEVFQIRKAPYATDDVIFECECYVLDLSLTAPRDAEQRYSLALGLAAAPTVDEVFG
jgi:predicted secreted protein